MYYERTMCMSRKKEVRQAYPEVFQCLKCGAYVTPAETGTHHRNHCPRCLWSRHVDIQPGDRRSGCRGDMEPIGIWIRRKREWALIHRCTTCGIIKTNRIAADDDEIALYALAARPVTEMPFPSEMVFSKLAGR